VLPKNFDAYVYQEMHEWLRHKPTMNPPHIQDLLHPYDGNLRATPEEHLPDVESPRVEEQQCSRSDAAFHTYTSAPAYDFTADSFNDCDDLPEETEESGGGNQTRSIFIASPIASTYSATYSIHQKLSACEAYGIHFLRSNFTSHR
jgi:hypothetical protein